ncbi:hypothetical protein AC1031_008640 [Aphanomyces cochlioides]|nr:hypothetical protein AC1031_008640 [Aphanomyces cochlioides]
MTRICVVVAIAITLVHAATVEFVNRCTQGIHVYDNTATCTLAPNTTGCHRALPSKQWNDMFRHNPHEQATLAEFSTDGVKIWYDISIVPPGSDNCTSLAQCMNATKKKGFNVPMSILPLQHRDDPAFNCVYVGCYDNNTTKCADGYQYPTDDVKTKSCPINTDMLVTFCPELPP